MTKADNGFKVTPSTSLYGYVASSQDDHLTYMTQYQNRRQEEKRHNRDGGSEPQGSSRSNRGTYDPVTGKWRPVPLSCISSLQTPPKAKRRVVRAISVGKITSEMWFEQRTPKECAPPRPSNALQRRPLLRIASSSLDNVLHAREKGFGETKRMFRRSGDHGLKCEGEERKREMLALMPTDPPSTDPMDSRGEDTEDAIDPEDEENLAPNPLQTVLRFHRPSATTRSTPTAHLGRTSSLDIIASSSRVKRLILHPPRSVSGPSIPSEVIPRLDKRNGSALQSNGESFKRVRRDSHHSSSSRSKPCFRQYEASDRSQPASDMTAPSAALMDHPGLLRSLSYSDRHGSTSARPNPCFRHHDSFDRSQPAQPAPEPGAPPTPLIGTPGLTRSVSFSSPASIFSVAEATLHRVDVHLGNTVYSRGTTMDVDRSEHEAEVDPDVLGAAAQLVQFMRKSGV